MTDQLSTQTPSPLVGEGGERSEPGEGLPWCGVITPARLHPLNNTLAAPSPPAPLPQGERGVSDLTTILPSIDSLGLDDLGIAVR